MNGQAGYDVLPKGLPSCKRCRGTGRMAVNDGDGGADVDVCDCVLEQMDTPGRTTTQE